MATNNVAVMNTPKVAIIGCGGIGSRIAQYFHQIKQPVLFVDGDIVERKNLDRQYFMESDIDKFKATALSDRGVGNLAFNRYISASNIIDILTYEPLRAVFICVDNLAARRDILEGMEYIQKNRFSELVKLRLIPFIFTGNAKTSGEAVYSTPNNLYYDQLYPDVMRTEHHDSPTDPCSEAISRGDEQTPLANQGAATLGLMLYAYYKRRSPVDPYMPIRHSFTKGKVVTLTLRELSQGPGDSDEGVDIDNDNDNGGEV